MNRQNKDIPHTIDPINIHHFLFKKPTSFTKPMMGSEIISTIKNLIIILIEREFTSIKLIISELMVFGSGIICGLLIFSKLVKWLLSNYFDKTLSFMLGLMIGGMNKIWPWQQNGEAVYPNTYVGNSNILLVIFFFILGWLFLIGLNFLEKNLTNEEKKNFKWKTFINN